MTSFPFPSAPNKTSILLIFSSILLILSQPAGHAQDTSLHDILIEGEVWQPAVKGFTFCDALAADAEGNLYFSDVKNGKGIYKLGLDGNVTLAVDNLPGISGLRVSADGRIYACQNKASRVIVIDKDGSVKELIPNIKCNDLTATKDGFVYVTETPTRRIHCITPDGKTFVADEGHVTRPNGITLSLDGTTLAVSEHGGVNVWAWQIQPDGKLLGAEPYMTMLLAPLNAPHMPREYAPPVAKVVSISRDERALACAVHVSATGSYSATLAR